MYRIFIVKNGHKMQGGATLLERHFPTFYDRQLH